MCFSIQLCRWVACNACFHLAKQNFQMLNCQRVCYMFLSLRHDWCVFCSGFLCQIGTIIVTEALAARVAFRRSLLTDDHMVVVFAILQQEISVLPMGTTQTFTYFCNTYVFQKIETADGYAHMLNSHINLTGFAIFLEVLENILTKRTFQTGMTTMYFIYFGNYLLV